MGPHVVVLQRLGLREKGQDPSACPWLCQHQGPAPCALCAQVLDLSNAGLQGTLSPELSTLTGLDVSAGASHAEEVQVLCCQLCHVAAMHMTRVHPPHVPFLCLSKLTPSRSST